VRSFTVTTTFIVAVLLLWAGPASAHAGLMPGDLVPGEVTEGELVIVHGCGPDGTIPGGDEDELATVGVTLDRPEGLSIDPREVEGWTLSTETGPDGEVTSARWEATDPAGEVGTIFLGVEVTADEAVDGTSVWVPVVQDCVEGEQLAWVAEHTDETGGALPAMLVNVDSAMLAASSSSSPADGGGLPTSVIITLAVAIAVIAGGGVAVVSARRG
jgi:uncharacterized protein YcnI